MASIFTMESATIYLGDTNPAQSNHLSLGECKWPAMEENFVDHIAGGAPVGIEINTHINKPEVTFNLAGWTPEALGLIGSWSKPNQHFTMIGAIRDRLTGKLFEAKGEAWGRLAKAAPGAFTKGQMFQHEYAIKGVVHYELTFNGKQLWYWDFFTNSLIIDGVDRMAETNTILGLATADGPAGGAEVGGGIGAGINS